MPTKFTFKVGSRYKARNDEIHEVVKISEDVRRECPVYTKHVLEDGTLSEHYRTYTLNGTYHAHKTSEYDLIEEIQQPNQAQPEKEKEITTKRTLKGGSRYKSRTGTIYEAVEISDEIRREYLVEVKKVLEDGTLAEAVITYTLEGSLYGYTRSRHDLSEEVQATQPISEDWYSIYRNKVEKGEFKQPRILHTHAVIAEVDGEDTIVGVYRNRNFAEKRASTKSRIGEKVVAVVKLKVEY